MNLFRIFFILNTFLSGISQQDEMILFNGVSLDNWKEIEFEGQGEVSVRDSAIIIGRGKEITGVKWTGDFPKTNYEVHLKAKRIEGSDFFCGMTFPVKESFVTLVLGGWGGGLIGLSCIDGYDAANNPTGQLFHFASGWWYSIRLKVTDKKIEAWVEDEKIVDFTINNSELSLRWEVETSVPFGITTYRTTGAIKNIRVKMTPE
jgi:hypothetical protein